MFTAEYESKDHWLWRRVTVDPVTGRITFHRCHRLNRFLSWGVEDEYSCSLSELRGVCWVPQPRIGTVLQIVTPAGRAALPRDAEGFDEVHAAILDGLPATARLRWYQYPSGQLLILLAITLVAGLVMAFLLTTAPPQKYVPALMAVMMLIVLVPLAIWFRGRPMW